MPLCRRTSPVPRPGTPARVARALASALLALLVLQHSAHASAPVPETLKSQPPMASAVIPRLAAPTPKPATPTAKPPTPTRKPVPKAPPPAKKASKKKPVAVLKKAEAKPTKTEEFDFEDVIAKAQGLAKEPFKSPTGQVPDWLLKITYDQWRNIRFKPDQALWREDKLPFQVQFFHPGLYYDRTVDINVIDRKGVHPVSFSPSQFDYGRNDFASKVPQNLGFAGFRLHAKIKSKKYYDEVIVFLGASYFRAVGRDQVFGLSARGLAINTALPSGEEFPYFKEFWLVRPKRHDKKMTVYALLDSPSLTGAYQFAVEPGEQTAVKVDLQLFLRTEVEKIGMAPLTSMFFHGENSLTCFDDFRPEVHDSDGLLLNFDSGEWLWRPLDNPRALQVYDLHMTNPKGFGLIQRDRDFDHYQDLETRPDLRPSVWVVPAGEWGDGHVELVEIPTKNDTNDNIVAFWVPEKKPKTEQPASLSYTLYWYGDDPKRPPDGRVVNTLDEYDSDSDVYRFVVDFSGEKLDALKADTVLRGAVSVASGEDTAEILEQHVIKNEVTGGWRLTFKMRPKKKGPIELRAFLDKGGDTLTETWSYAIAP